jgi:hypothetical protein
MNATHDRQLAKLKRDASKIAKWPYRLRRIVFPSGAVSISVDREPIPPVHVDQLLTATGGEDLGGYSSYAEAIYAIAQTQE